MSNGSASSPRPPPTTPANNNSSGTSSWFPTLQRTKSSETTATKQQPPPTSSPPPPTSGFGFLSGLSGTGLSSILNSSSPAISSQQAVEETPKSSFGFISSSSSNVATNDGLPFTVGPPPPSQLPLAPPPSSSEKIPPLSAIKSSPPLQVQPAGVRKKRTITGTRKPGFARAGGDDDMFEGLDNPTPGGGSSLLSGLTVHVGGTNNTSSDAPQQQQQQQPPPPHAAPVQPIPSSQDRSPVQAPPLTTATTTTTTTTPPTPPNTTNVESTFTDIPSPVDEPSRDVVDDDLVVVASPEPASSIPPPSSHQQQQTNNRKRNSSAITLDSASATFAQELGNIDHRIQQLAQQGSTSQDEIQRLSTCIKTWEEEQQQATNAEEFERAEALEVQMSEARRNIQRLESTARDVESQQVKLETQRESLCSQNLFEVEKFVTETETLADRLSVHATTFARQTEVEALTTRKRLDESKDEVTRNLEAATMELTDAETEMGHIKDRIATGTVELRAELDTWLSKTELVSGEIERLEKLLLEKRKERDEYQARIADMQAELNAVEQRYDSRLDEVRARENECRARISTLVSENEKLEHTRQTQETRQRDNEAKLAKMNHDAKGAKHDLSLLQAFQARMKRESVTRRKVLLDLSHERTGITALREAVITKKNRHESTRFEIEKLEREVFENGRTSAAAARDLPGLEDQKTAAIAARNFKDAGNVTKEIKALQQKRVDALEAIEAGKVSLEAKRKTFQDEIDALAQLMQDLTQAEKEFAVRRVRDFDAQIKNAMDGANVLRAEMNDDGATPSVIAKALLDMYEAEQKSAKITRDIFKNKAKALGAVISDDADDTVKEEGNGQQQQVVTVEDSQQQQQQQETPVDVHGDGGALPTPDVVNGTDTTAVNEDVKKDDNDDGTTSNMANDSQVPDLVELETQLNSAISSDDFDLAAIIEEKIKMAKAHREEMTATTSSSSETKIPLATTVTAEE